MGHTRVFVSDSPEGQKILVLFYEARCIFSNFHPAKFAVNVNENKEKEEVEAENIVHFTCSEQYFMYKKALLVGDKVRAEQILNTTNPMRMKFLGRELKMSRGQLADWSNKSRDAMYRACYEKFSQNTEHRQMLFRTHGMTLVEASPTDQIWGIGLGKMDKRAENPKEWQGTNWLGEVLDRVRDELWNYHRFRADRLKIESESLAVRCHCLENH